MNRALVYFHGGVFNITLINPLRSIPCGIYRNPPRVVPQFKLIFCDKCSIIER